LFGDGDCAGGTSVGGCCDGVSVGGVVPISISRGRDWARSGALKMRRPVIAPPIRLESDPRAMAGRPGSGNGTEATPGTELVCEFAVRALRARMRLMCRSRRTMTLVILTGHAPFGNTLCLHIGHSDE